MISERVCKCVCVCVRARGCDLDQDTVYRTAAVTSGSEVTSVASSICAVDPDATRLEKKSVNAWMV